MPEITFGGPFEPIQGSDFIQEDLSAQIQSGGTTQYTTSEAFQPTRLIVYRNGLYQGPPGGSEINVIDNETFTIATTVQQGETIMVIYSPLLKT
jgi:hypothetical protein